MSGLNFNLHSKQAMAFYSTATEILYAGRAAVSRTSCARAAFLERRPALSI
jgi:hypothetical protein